MIKITWNAITLLLLVLACSILFFVCNKSNKLEQVKAPTFNTDKLEVQIQNLTLLVDSLKKTMEIREERKTEITNYYHTVLKRNEGLSEKQIDTVYSLDTMSSHEIAGNIERADYFESLYKEQMGIDTIRQQVISTLESKCDFEQELNNVLYAEIKKTKRKLESRNWWLKTVSAICGAAIVGVLIK